MRRSFSLLALLTVAAAPAAFGQQAVSWDTLSKVRAVQQGGQTVPEFDAEVRALEGERITVRGFMLPLEQGAQQQNFLLTVVPMADCFYCLQHGPGSMLEVVATRPARYTYSRVAVTGRLEFVPDDPLGMYYRLADARVEG